MCTGHDLALTAFREGLRETGYVEGHNVQIDYRWSGEQRDLLLALTADLVRPQRDRDLQRSWQRAWLRVGSALGEKADNRHRLLRPCRERPRGCRAAERG